MKFKKKKKAGSGIECLRQMALGLILSRNFYSLYIVFRPGIYLNKSFQKQIKFRINESLLRIALAWREMSFCQSQVQRGTFNKPVTAIKNHHFQGVRSNKKMIRHISLRIQSEMRQTVQMKKWYPELHRYEAFPQPSHFFY